MLVLWLRLLFGPEGGGGMLLRNVDPLLLDCTSWANVKHLQTRACVAVHMQQEVPEENRGAVRNVISAASWTGRSVKAC
jgi:hypothetical protein